MYHTEWREPWSPSSHGNISTAASVVQLFLLECLHSTADMIRVAYKVICVDSCRFPKHVVA